jgi:hypothetical protein
MIGIQDASLLSALWKEGVKPSLLLVVHTSMYYIVQHSESTHVSDLERQLTVGEL